MHVVKAQQQGDDGGLAGAGVTHERDRVSGIDSEGNIAQHPVELVFCVNGRGNGGGGCGELLTLARGLLGGLRQGAIGEPHVVELDASRAVGKLRSRRRNDLRPGVEQFENALARRHRRLQDVVLLAQVLDGTEEALRILHKRDQYSQADGVAEDLVAAKPHHAGDGDGRQHFDHRVVDGVRQDRVLEGVHVGAVDLLEALVGFLLAIEQLQDDDSRDVLLQVGIDFCNCDADAPVTFTHRLAEQCGGVEDERQHSERDQRQLPAHVEHDGEYAGEHEDVFEDRNHARGEHFVEGVDVAGHASYEAANGIAVEERNVQLLQVAEDLRSQIEHHLLSHPLHDVGLGELEQEADQEQSNVDGRDLRDSHERLRTEETVEQGMGLRTIRKVLVDRNFRQVRAENVSTCLENDGDQRNDYLQPIRTQIRQQPLHQPAVVGFAEYVLFVDGGHVPETIVAKVIAMMFRRWLGWKG